MKLRRQFRLVLSLPHLANRVSSCSVMFSVMTWSLSKMRFASLLHGLMLLLSWGFGLYSSRRNFPAQPGLSDNKYLRRFSSFSTSTVTLYSVWVGGVGSKNYQELKRGGGWTNSTFANWGGGERLHNYFLFEAHFIAPSPPDNYCTVPKFTSYSCEWKSTLWLSWCFSLFNFN